MEKSTLAPHAYYGHVDGTLVLRLSGPIRFVTCQALRGFVDSLRGGDGEDVLIDLRDVQTIDSTGMGLLARIGRSSLESRGRRAAIACPGNDIATTLRSAAFDTLFTMLDAYPFDDHDATFAEMPLGAGEPDAGSDAQISLGRVILDAHRDLASMSEHNVEVYRDVIAALETELRTTRGGPS
jgi:anti-anti-sigma factor